MNGKLLYNAIRRLVGQDIHGNDRLPKRCPQDVTNYMGIKPFWSHSPPVNPNPNHNPSNQWQLSYLAHMKQARYYDLNLTRPSRKPMNEVHSILWH